MARRKDKLVVVAGTDFDRSYAGTLHLLESLGAEFEVEAYVFTDAGGAGGMPACRSPAVRLRGAVPSGRRCLKLTSKLFRILSDSGMLFARRVLITETAYLREAALAKTIKATGWSWRNSARNWPCPKSIRTTVGRGSRSAGPGCRISWIDVDPLRAVARAELMACAKRPTCCATPWRWRACRPGRRPGAVGAGGIAPPPPGLPVLAHAGGVAREKPFERIIDAVAALPERSSCSRFVRVCRRHPAVRDYAAG
jgi:hypothetical protein